MTRPRSLQLASSNSSLHAVEAIRRAARDRRRPRQSHPVGAGGLWPHLEPDRRRARTRRVQLTQNLRAQDAADRRDQRLFRDGQHLRAVRGYADRARIHRAHTRPATANDAGAPRRLPAIVEPGDTLLVIAQTSNEHLDELNARAQAHPPRRTDELGAESLPLPGRPYRLHTGDQVQVRHTIHHPDTDSYATAPPPPSPPSTHTPRPHDSDSTGRRDCD